jgi:hypothetical protein
MTESEALLQQQGFAYQAGDLFSTLIETLCVCYRLQ